MSLSPRQYTTSKKLKLMTAEELKNHKFEQYKRHYEKNKKEISEKHRIYTNQMYNTNEQYKKDKLIYKMKFNNKLTDEEINIFNHCYQHIKEYAKNKRRYKTIIEKMINRKPLNQIRILTVE